MPLLTSFEITHALGIGGQILGIFIQFLTRIESNYLFFKDKIKKMENKGVHSKKSKYKLAIRVHYTILIRFKKIKIFKNKLEPVAT